jgi:hypothetical protein
MAMQASEISATLAAETACAEAVEGEKLLGTPSEAASPPRTCSRAFIISLRSSCLEEDMAASDSSKSTRHEASKSESSSWRRSKD